MTHFQNVLFGMGLNKYIRLATGTRGRIAMTTFMTFQSHIILPCIDPQLMGHYSPASLETYFWQGSCDQQRDHAG